MDWLKGVLNQVTVAFRAMTAAQRASMVMLGLTIVVALGLVAVLGARPKYVAAASGLDQAEMRDATGLLDGSGEKYKLDVGRGAILVPQDRQPAVAAMFQRSQVVAKEKIFDKDAYRSTIGGDIFMSQGERDKHRRDAQAGELRKMIVSLNGVESCLVAITDEDPGEFVINPEKIGVSVTVTPRGGKKIDQAFANSIIDLVSSAVRNCDLSRIVVIDTRNPARQFHKEDSDTEVAIGNKRLALSREIEQHYQRKIDELLSSMHYEGVAIVNCKEVDLDKVKRLVQTVKPDEVVTVSQKTRKLDSTGATGTGGATGGIVNEPNASAGGVTGPASSSSGTPSRAKESESEARSICSFVTEEIQKAPGQIAKLTASVVINARIVEKLDKDTGKVVQSYEMPSDDMKKDWRNLIAKIMGIEGTNQDDIDKAVSICFWNPPRDDPGILTAAPKSDIKEMVASYWPFARVGGVLMLTAVAFFFLYALGKKAATAPPPEVVVQASSAAPGESSEEPGSEHDDIKLRQLQDKLRGVIGEDPRRVASLVKRWLVREG